MAIEIRPIAPDETSAFMRTTFTAFGNHPTPEDIERECSVLEPERGLAAFEDGQLAGSAAALSLELTLPGLRRIPVAGVSFVSVLPAHRRRGILRELMQRQLADVRERGEMLAALTASEGLIYGRFGYGTATSRMNFEIERAYGALLPAEQSAGRVRLIAEDEARRLLPPLYDEIRRAQPGAVSRSDAFWPAMMFHAHRGDPPIYFVAYEAQDGRITGAAYYRIQSAWEEGLAQGTLQLVELLATTPEAYAALWRYCLAMDLVRKVRAVMRPVYEPLRWLLADQRRMRVTALYDDLWLRLVDIPGALAARGYTRADRLIFEVADAFLPGNSGRYLLDASAEGATCRATAAEADLALGVADLGAAYLGGVPFSVLARAGRVAERTPGALARADALFATALPPYSGTPF